MYSVKSAEVVKGRLYDLIEKLLASEVQRKSDCIQECIFYIKDYMAKDLAQMPARKAKVSKIASERSKQSRKVLIYAGVGERKLRK
ncbi:hypothetical protein [Polynucleobacter sp.]|uniref:hypothetical protein n=1 Tax=Polynucleobacter sp. TaxID=2029855 RepID=UPI003F699C16